MILQCWHGDTTLVPKSQHLMHSSISSTNAKNMKMFEKHRQRRPRAFYSLQKTHFDPAKSKYFNYKPTAENLSQAKPCHHSDIYIDIFFMNESVIGQRLSPLHLHFLMDRCKKDADKSNDALENANA